MHVPPTITFRRIRPSAALDSDIRTRLERLETFYPSIMGARVLVEPVERHHRGRHRYHVRIDLTVPGGGTLAIANEAAVRQGARARGAAAVRKQDERDRPRRDLHVAIRAAFAVARRRLQDYARIQRGSVKQHTATGGGPIPSKMA